MATTSSPKCRSVAHEEITGVAAVERGNVELCGNEGGAVGGVVQIDVLRGLLGD